MANPLEQFAIHRYADLSIGGADAAFTNASVFMLLILGITIVFFWLGSRKPEIVPGRWQAALESITGFAVDMAVENIGPKGRRWVPFIFSLFLFILIANVVGLFPYSFTVTSHIVVTFAFAALIFLICVVLGFILHGFHFLSLFVPPGAPLLLMPVIIPIEVISFLARPLTLSVRLFANMTAGHILLKVFAGFVISLGLAGGFFTATAVLPFAMTVAFYGLELIVAVVQAYVFALLTAIYLNDSINLH